MSYVGKITDTSGNTGLVGSTLYGTCTTEASTSAKVVTCSDFDKLLTGVTIHVKFTNQYTGDVTPTLNVNNTGAKSITVGTHTTGNMTLTKKPTWNNGQVVSFTYDGTNWCMNEYFERNTDTKVTQTESTTNSNYEVLLSGTASTATRTEDVLKSSGFRYNPSLKAVMEGEQTYASTTAAHAEGYKTTASGSYSHAEGRATAASGEDAHCEGYNTIASGFASHAEGNNTTANHNAQHVFGMNNIADPSTAAATARGNYVEIVGNGVTSSAKSNARTLDWDGNEWLAGGIDIGDASVQYQGDSSNQYYYNLTASLKLEDYYETGIPFPTLQLHSDFYDGSDTTKRSTLMMPGVIKLQYPVSISDTSVITMSSSDITLSGSTGVSSNTWDGTNTSLKSAFTHTPYVVPCPETDEYPMILGPNNDTDWICFGGADGSKGIIPSKKGAQGSGHCNIGTASWYWANSYIDNMYGGILSTSSDKWYTDAKYAINLNNSDIVGINGLYFSDRVDSKGEGIMFARSNGNWDDLYSYDGSLRYCVNRSTTGERGSYYTILHTGNGVSNNGGTYTGGNKTAGKCMHGVGTGHSYACEWGSNLAFWVDVTKVATVSDRRLKDDIEPINMNLVKSIAECPSYQYKAFNRNGLISVGIIAQDLVENCKKYDVDPLKYELMTQEEFIDGDPTLYYHIEYDQLLYFKTLYLEQKVKELEEKLNELT